MTKYPRDRHESSRYPSCTITLCSKLCTSSIHAIHAATSGIPEASEAARNASSRLRHSSTSSHWRSSPRDRTQRTKPGKRFRKAASAPGHACRDNCSLPGLTVYRTTSSALCIPTVWTGAPDNPMSGASRHAALPRGPGHVTRGDGGVPLPNPSPTTKAAFHSGFLLYTS